MSSTSREYIKLGEDLSNDLTKCSLCQSTFEHPRKLHCLHTFCLNCLQLEVDKSPSSEQKTISCKICSQNCQVPSGELEQLPRNEFVELLIKSSASKRGNNTNKTEPKICCNPDAEEPQVVVNYCVDCKEEFCERCTISHKQRIRSRNHTIIKCSEEATNQNEQLVHIIDNDNTRCQTHPDDHIIFFCDKCMLPICKQCAITEHNGHNYSSLEKTSNELKVTLGSTDLLTTSMENLKQELRRQEDDKYDFLDELSSCVQTLDERYKALTKLIDTEHQRLREQYDMIKADRIKEIECRENKIKLNYTLVASLKHYSDELLEKGTDCDVCRSTHEILHRTKKLHDDQSILCKTKLPVAKVSFTACSLYPTGSIRDGKLSFIGNAAIAYESSSAVDSDENQSVVSAVISASPEYDQSIDSSIGKDTSFNSSVTDISTSDLDSDTDPDRFGLTRLKRIEVGGEVRGVAKLCSSIYVACKPHTIRVYQSKTFDHIQDIVIQCDNPQLKSCDIVACNKNMLLYILIKATPSDHEHARPRCLNRVHVLPRALPHSDRLWLLTAACSLSVMSEGRVLLLVNGSAHRELHIYTEDARHVHSIRLESNIIEPQHAIEFQSGLLVVSEGRAHRESESAHRINILDRNGHVHRSFGLKRREELDNPCHLAADPSGRIYVADCCSDRVLRLDSNLSNCHVILSKNVNSSLSRPFRLCFVLNQLIVGFRNGFVDVYSVEMPKLKS